MIPQKVDRYEILRELGRGGQSIAYLAKDPIIGRLVAIKLMQPGLGSTPEQKKEYLQRFLREAQAAGRLMHGNIAVIYDVGDAEGSPFIAMEYIEGDTLSSLLAKSFPLPVPRVVHLLVQVLQGLHYAHEHGIIHRDIKPGNIMVTRADIVKLVDFGIAKLDSTQVTSPGNVIGTPSYMSPEQITGEKIDSRSDLFSAGVVLYQCLAGKLPFTGEHATTVIYRILHEPFPSLDFAQLGLARQLDDVLKKALAKKPVDRFSSGLEMARSLEQLMAEPSALTLHDPQSTVSIDIGDISLGGASAGNLQPAPRSSSGTKKTKKKKPAGPGGLETQEKKDSTGILLKYWIVATGGVLSILLFGVLWIYLSKDREAAIIPSSSSITNAAQAMTTSTMVSENSFPVAAVTTTLEPAEKVGSTAADGTSTTLKKETGQAQIVRRASTTLRATSSTLDAGLATTSTLPALDQTMAPSTSLIAPPTTVPSATGNISHVWRINAIHSHLMGNCKGILIISSESLEYYPEKGNHYMKVLVSDMDRLNWRDNSNRFRISLQLKNGKENNFEAEGTENKEQLKQAYEALRQSYLGVKPKS